MNYFQLVLLQVYTNPSGTDFTYKTLLALTAALIASYLTRLFSRNKEKVAMAFEFHKEFNSYEMHLHRKKADKLLKDFPNLMYEDLGNLTNEELPSVFVILSFFQRLSQAIKYNQVKKKIVLNLFSEPFCFWYYVSYEKNLVPLNWEASKQISYLANWFETKMHENSHLSLKTEMNTKFSNRFKSGSE